MELIRTANYIKRLHCSSLLTPILADSPLLAVTMLVVVRLFAVLGELRFVSMRCIYSYCSFRWLFLDAHVYS